MSAIDSGRAGRQGGTGERVAAPDGARVAIGLPVYNGENFVESAIESVLAQTISAWQLIISDNASTDRTESICRDYARRDARIRYHRAAANRGIVWNYNEVFRLCTSEYFMWFAHDDALEPGYLERCIDVLDADESVVLCFSACRDIDSQGRQISVRSSRVVMESRDPVARFRAAISLEHLCEPWCGVTRSRVLRGTPLYGPFADYDRVMIAELGLHGRLIEIAEPLFINREHVSRSHQVYATRFERTRWLDPRNAQAIVFPHFRQLKEFWAAVRRAHLAPRDRLRCAWALVRWAGAYRRRLRSDLTVAARETLREALGRASPAH